MGELHPRHPACALPTQVPLCCHDIPLPPRIRRAGILQIRGKLHDKSKDILEEKKDIPRKHMPRSASPGNLLAYLPACKWVHGAIHLDIRKSNRPNTCLLKAFAEIRADYGLLASSLARDVTGYLRQSLPV